MALLVSNPLVQQVDVTTSTNDVLARWWKETPLPPASAVYAEYQSAGRGRGGHNWVAPPRTSVLVSVLLAVQPSLLTHVPLAAGMALAEALTLLLPAPASVQVKWPNDVLIDGNKVAGILAENLGPSPWNHLDGRYGIALGIGINVTQTRAELPPRPATSLSLEGAGSVDQCVLIEDVYARVEEHLENPGFLRDYQSRCYSVGRTVVAVTPDGKTLEGEAVGIGKSGELLVQDDVGNVHPISAGDTQIKAGELH